MNDVGEAARDTLVVVSAHPDDIVCCGGIVARCARAGYRVVQLSVTRGETVRPPGPQQEEIKVLRQAEGDAIARILGATSEYLGVPGNKIIPTMEMKMLLVNALRRIGTNIILFPTPWDCHADHRNLSWTMRDVVYYVGHPGIAADYSPCTLKAAYMYDIEVNVNELHPPDFVVDVSDTEPVNFQAILCEERARVFGKASGQELRRIWESWTRFWGMRHDVEYAEPLWNAYGSMATMDPGRKRQVVKDLPHLGNML
ncbi:MAG: PIG-L family deacetylase [Armatimonadetes bacterium]|nr:PIG-L family deacetylase [Armatimonadota bacterium]